MVVTSSVSSISNRLRSALQVNRCSITTHARIDGLVYKVDIEPELTAVIRDGLFQIIDEKLWRDALNPWSASGRWRCHLFSLDAGVYVSAPPNAAVQRPHAAV